MSTHTSGIWIRAGGFFIICFDRTFRIGIYNVIHIILVSHVRYGSIPHGGYGVGFERLVCLVTAMDNIRDAVAFPRVPGNAFP
jgi:hypothetical protein